MDIKQRLRLLAQHGPEGAKETLAAALAEIERLEQLQLKASLLPCWCPYCKQPHGAVQDLKS